MIAVAIFDFELSKGSVSQSVACVRVTGSSRVLPTTFFNKIHLVLKKLFSHFLY